MEGTTETISSVPNREENSPDPEQIGQPLAAESDDPETEEQQPAAIQRTAPSSTGITIRNRANEVEVKPRNSAEVTLRTLLEAGAHFGHQTSRWNPKMAPYIYTARNGIHIINLPRSVQTWKAARKGIIDIVSRGGNVLFVGTKKQAQQAVIEEALRCNSPYVSRRWLGGMITNFQTIRRSIERMQTLETTLKEEEEALSSDGSPKFTKKERLMMSREHEKLDFSLGGIRELHGPPQLFFVIDIKREDIAVKEAKRLDVPVVALVDTNCDPETVAHAIPCNDDGTKAIRLFCQALADAVIEGRKLYSERKVQEAKEAARQVKRSKKNNEPDKDESGGETKAVRETVKTEVKAKEPKANAKEAKAKEPKAEAKEAEAKEPKAEAKQADPDADAKEPEAKTDEPKAAAGDGEQG